MFNLEDVMRPSMDYDDLCYFVDGIDDFVADYVLDLLLKGKLDDILEEDP